MLPSDKYKTESEQLFVNPFGDSERRSINVTVRANAASDGVAADGQRILDIIHNGPTISAMSPEVARASRQSRGNLFDYADALDVQKTDILISTSGGDLAARMYRPSALKDKFSPAIAYYHGGGFVLGSVQDYDKLTAQLAERANIVVISVDYRLAPEYPFPIPLHDVQQSFLWLIANAFNLQLDPGRIAIGGDSAGANLSAVTCMLNREQSKPLPMMQLLIYPSVIGNKSTVSRKEFSEGLLLTKETLKWYHGHYIADSEANDPRFNVLEAEDHSNLPPALVLTAGYDPLRDEGEAYANKLRASGVEVRHSCYTDMFHAFLSFGSLPQAQAALDECASVLSWMLNRNVGGITDH